MCIAIVTTEHPHYPFILLNNRDEYLHRPTADATWWPEPDTHVLGGYDLHRPVHGTWLGVTRQGRIAVLTNYREEGEAIIEGARSRGLIPNAWLKSDPKADESSEQFAHRLVDEDGVKGVGGFSLLYGKIRDVVKSGGKGLAIISNRTPDADRLIWVAKKANETHALSNAAHGDRSWPKVVNGEKEVKAAVDESVGKGEDRNQLLERLFAVLSHDTMPRQKENEEWDMYLNQLRHSIFVPAIGKDDLEEMNMPAHPVGDVVKLKAANPTAGVYGTQKQIVIMVDKDGKAFYVERSLFDGDAQPVERGKGDKVFKFQIEGW
ncbi:NRDE protein-domain-containing protein [Clohesyomyces aquaticus]|uniref:NRDE protein-domain-containing protein n=1 Tax=Clohesyomyces aquaticus TaxID=1231657 RepID=A0A1Y1ZW91_9PLEO|nr:NRDE protein-domain-containing protein [Clohesyomyces aquaticus]